MADRDGRQIVSVSIGEPSFAQPVLERLVSAAAARADLPVDRLVNALTVVDALVHASDSVLVGSREVSISIGDRELALRVDGLLDGQAESLRDAGAVPGVGNVFERTASDVSIEHDGLRSALILTFD
jgi:hypothetical protein